MFLIETESQSLSVTIPWATPMHPQVESSFLFIVNMYVYAQI